MIPYIIHTVFATYTLMLLGRIILSWAPQLIRYRFTQFLIFYTDPYLNLFRKVVPPIGGMFDLSPLLGFFALRYLEKILLSVL